MFVGDDIILLNQNVISNVDHFMNIDVGWVPLVLYFRPYITLNLFTLTTRKVACNIAIFKRCFRPLQYISDYKITNIPYLSPVFLATDVDLSRQISVIYRVVYRIWSVNPRRLVSDAVNFHGSLASLPSGNLT